MFFLTGKTSSGEGYVELTGEQIEKFANDLLAESPKPDGEGGVVGVITDEGVGKVVAGLDKIKATVGIDPGTGKRLGDGVNIPVMSDREAKVTADELREPTPGLVTPQEQPDPRVPIETIDADTPEGARIHAAV